ncbi:hypothetical protein MAXJ12_23032 [Mesorhizobium alhagi CCNWXJ12-2]|uniref:Uncharacterized protein n=1 Tax=Mesorhizobium alhagi CCNWXJ12-2 TaxID=1107882 RepID=H0HWP1_9HYPH|nr:hypothetical protein MAXJ12_23032 [Mesorhizobium alhagi CCNWXJ12-2]
MSATRAASRSFFAKTDLGGCGRVVLVDNGHSAGLEKLFKGQLCIETAMLVFYILTGQ